MNIGKFSSLILSVIQNKTEITEIQNRNLSEKSFYLFCDNSFKMLIKDVTKPLSSIEPTLFYNKSLTCAVIIFIILTNLIETLFSPNIAKYVNVCIIFFLSETKEQ